MDAPVQLDTTPLAGARVLVAEDHEDNQALMRYYLEAAGAIVLGANNGQEAIAQIEAATEPFDVVFMDMQMPVMDGYTASKQLRKSGYRGIIVALTGHAMEGERERCMESGCSDYLSKPATREDVVRKVLRYVPVRVTQASAAHGGA